MPEKLRLKAGAGVGLYGAKITGGGSGGGTIAVLGRKEAGAAVEKIVEIYESETGRCARIFSGSSPGAGEFGTKLLTRRPEL